MTCAALVVPLGLEVAGIVPRSYVFSNGSMIVVNRVIDLTAWGMIGVFGVSAVVLTLAVGVFFIRLREVLSDAELRLHLYAWHLRQLVPPTEAP
jgi:eukaryotic-like serine/threonine-protein kinase